jgi:hypothetical protein
MKDWLADIPDYLLGRMTDSDRQAFETELVSNAELRDALDRARIVDQSLDILAKEQLSTELLDIQTAIARGRTIRLLVTVAASIALLMMVYFGFMHNNIDGTQLYSEYYQAPLDETQRNGTDDTRSILQQGIALFQTGNYQECKDVLHSTTGTQQEVANYYIAHALLAQDSLRAARLIFDELSVSSGLYGNKSEWFAMLASLKLERRKEFKTRLDAILKQPGHEYFDKANSLANAL